MSELNYKTYTFTIQEDNANLRLDKALLAHESIVSRSQASKLFKLEFITVNSKFVKPSYITKMNDIIIFKIPETQMGELSLAPYDIDLNIVFEDEHLIIVNKPAGLVMHPSAGHLNDSLVNALIAKKIKLSMGMNEERPGIVHRIDKDTSGLVVVAKDNETHVHLAEQFRNKTVHRVYHAITYGYFNVEKDIIESYLIRHPRDRKKYSNERLQENIKPKGKKAITHYEVIDQNKGVSLVKCQLETGRTHQIRVHLSEKNHSVVNDPIYSSSRMLSNVQSKHIRSGISDLNGIGLLAKEIGFVHPKTGNDILFKCIWPEDTLPLLNHLGWSND